MMDFAEQIRAYAIEKAVDVVEPGLVDSADCVISTAKKIESYILGEDKDS